MKLLTITIPCYNSQGYMQHAIESALSAGKNVILISVRYPSSSAVHSNRKELNFFLHQCTEVIVIVLSSYWK